MEWIWQRPYYERETQTWKVSMSTGLSLLSVYRLSWSQAYEISLRN